MLIMATVLHLGKSSLPKKPITDDDVERLSLCLKVLSESTHESLMSDIFNKECRRSLSHMLTVRLEEEKLSQKVNTSVSLTVLLMFPLLGVKGIVFLGCLSLNINILCKLINILDFFLPHI